MRFTYKMDGIVRESMIEDYVLRQQKELRLSIKDTTSLMKTLLLGFMLKRLSTHNTVFNPTEHRIERIIMDQPPVALPPPITPMHPISKRDIPSVVFPTNDALNPKIVPHELWTKHVLKNSPI